DGMASGARADDQEGTREPWNVLARRFRASTGSRMKRQFEYKQERTHLFWEIERSDSLLTKRSWGRSRPEVLRVRRFGSEADAERGYEEEIQSRLSDGYVEIGPGAKKAEPRPRLWWRSI